MAETKTGPGSKPVLEGVLKRWVPNVLDYRPWLLLSPVLVFFAIYWLTCKSALHLLPKTLKFWEYTVYSFTIAAVGYWVILGLLTRHFKTRWPAIVFAWLYLFFYGVNTGMMHHAGTVLEHYYLTIVDLTNWTIYLTKPIYALIGLFALCCWGTSVLIRRHAHSVASMPLGGLVVFLVLLFAAPYLSEKKLFRPTYVLNKIAKTQGTGLMLEGQTPQLRVISRNPIEIMGRAVFCADQMLERHPVAELASKSNILSAWNLPLGERAYPSLNLKPFEHVVVFATESLSADMLSPFNKELPPEQSPWYSSTEAQQIALQNYWTVSLPTQYGIETTYNSHPNASALLHGNAELSLIKLLKGRGYHTIFLKSDSENFANDSVYYKRLGFDEVIGMETFKKDSRLSPYIDGRGLMDRLLYRRAAELLREYDGKPLFIHVAGQDTHSPLPRDYFADLEYPPLPKIPKLEDPDARQILSGAFHHDYDLGNAIKDLRECKLLNEHTLVVLTADHSYPGSPTLERIPGYRYTGFYARIPFILISGQTLPKVDVTQVHSQLDFAPTLAHLVGLPIQPGWWGQSIFINKTSPTIVSRDGDSGLRVFQSGEWRQVSSSAPANDYEKGLFELYNQVYTDSK